MKITELLNIPGLLIGTKIFNRRVPFAVTWALLYRCNQRCKYCGVWKNKSSELGSTEIFDMINKFKRLGTRWITFTGGEPLLRGDLGEIIKYAKEKGIFVSLSSNGSLVAERIGEIRYADRIKLSLDGPQEIHDYVREEGSFKKVLNAIESCKKASIPVCLECVLSRHNLESLDFIIELAKRYNLKVLFQPATKNLLGSKEANPLCAPVDKYRAAIKYLIDTKKAGAPIYNSLPGLMHLFKWPDNTLILCNAGMLGCRVEADGRIINCARNHPESFSPDGQCGQPNVEQQIKELQLVSNCGQCWCSSSVEFNLAFSFNIRAIGNMIKNIR